MKKFVFFPLFFITVSLFAESVPTWLNNLEKEFPSSDYIRAIGNGRTEKKARADALSVLTMRFKTNVKTINTAIQDLTLATENENSTFAKKQVLHQETEIASDADLYCVQFTESFYNSKRKEYSVVGYIDKDSASKILKSKIEAVVSQIENLKNLSLREKEPLYSLLYYQQAKIYGEIAREYIDTAICINPLESDPYDENLRLIESIDSFIANQKNKVTFSVECKNEDCIALNSDVSYILSQSGFVLTTTEPMYKIIIDVAFSEEEYEAGEFVRPSVNIIVLNWEEKAVESYSKAYPRYGHRSMKNAYNLAIVRIGQDLDENFLIAYRGFK